MTFSKLVEPWCYPIFTLPAPLDGRAAKGLVLRARLLHAGRNVDLMMQESPAKAGFWMTNLFPADGEWHTVYLPFSDFRVMPGNPDMQNAVFDVAKVRILEIGFASDVADNAMEISDLLVVGD